MATYRPSPITPKKSPHSYSLQNSTFLSHSGLNDTLHSTQSLSGRSSIMTYKNKQYASASAALAAYINDFENAHPLRMSYHRTVEDLLTPRSVLLRTVDRSLDTGVRDTRAEWRRYVSKKLLDESYSEMVDEDVAREKAQALIESSRLLTADLSPLPGSSVITEMESEASMSTDALLQAPLYPPLKQPPPPRNQESVSQRSQRLKTEAFNRIENQKRKHLVMNGLGLQEYRLKSSGDGLRSDTVRRLHVAAMPKSKSPLIPQFPSDISPVKKQDVIGSASQLNRNGFAEKATRTETFLQSGNMTTRWSPSKDEHGKGMVGSRREGQNNIISLPRQNHQADGRRPPPSWIQHLDASSGVSGLASETSQRAPPSWIQDLEASGPSSLPAQTHSRGRAPPSWVQDLAASEISSAVPFKTSEQGDRPPPSWIQDLNSTMASGLQSDVTTTRHGGNLASHKLHQGRQSSQKMLSRDGLRRSHSARNLSKSETHFTRFSELSKPPGLTFRDFDHSESILRGVDKPGRFQEDLDEVFGSLDLKHSKRAVKFREDSRHQKAHSFTTDDLILASPTGKGFHVPSHDSRGQYSSQDVFSRKHLLDSQRQGFQRGLSVHETASAEHGSTDLLSSTPKHLVSFEPSFASHSVNGYRSNEGLVLRSGGGHSRDTYTGRMKRTIGDDDREREDALLERAEKVLIAARETRSKPSHSLHHHHDDADRQEDVDRQNNSLLTEEILEGDRPWERNLPSHKSVKSVPAQDKLQHRDIVSQFLDDCIKSASENQKLTGGSQPGPVEALKNMLFTLQGMDPNPQMSLTQESSFSPHKVERQMSSTGATSSSSESKYVTGLENSRKGLLDRDTTSSSGSGTNFDEAPGGKSLQRAMEHLSRLKVLVNGGGRLDSHPSSTKAQVMSN